MADPFCTIPWAYEGFQEIQFYNVTGRVEVAPMCQAMRDAIWDAETLDALRETVERVAAELGVAIAQFTTGPDHSDPLRQFVRVTLKASPPG